MAEEEQHKDLQREEKELQGGRDSPGLVCVLLVLAPRALGLVPHDALGLDL